MAVNTLIPLRDNVPTERFPIVTVALILACVAVFAHVGGFVFGLAPIKLFAQRQPGSRRPLFAH